MEEDIKILESECYYLEELGYLRENNHFIRFNQALENLVKGYKKLEVENEELKRLANNKQFFSHIYIVQKYIPKSKIKEKIEELKAMNLECETFDSMRNYAVLILQELMEDK